MIMDAKSYLIDNNYFFSKEEFLLTHFTSLPETVEDKHGIKGYPNLYTPCNSRVTCLT